MLKNYFTRTDTRWGFFKEDLKITLCIYAVSAAVGAGLYLMDKKKNEKKDEELVEEEVRIEDFEPKEWGESLD